MAVQLWKEYKDADSALSAIKNYFQRCEDNNQDYFGEVDLALGIKVSLEALRSWKNGDNGKDFKDVADWAYMQIARAFETNAKFNEDKVAARKAVAMMQQPLFQGYSTKGDAGKNTKMKIQVSFGDGMDESDFG